ncbi:major facilitator superfamily domain-containing protein [Lipomyces japonicus]|uniref:major facilitator superfamily domain-containing protein n=1 Tax=Lipomyces japonicus TaxID=56871 RepID=UPI0034CFB00E
MTDLERGEGSNHQLSNESNSSSETDFDPEQILSPIVSLEVRHKYEEAGIPLTITKSRTDAADDQEFLQRVLTEKSISEQIVGGPGAGQIDGRPLPAFGKNKSYPPLLPDREKYVVEWDGIEDPDYPHNFPLKKKIKIMSILGFVTTTAAWGSSIFSTATEIVALKFHVSNVVAILAMSLYVLGFASGPLLWAPFSELSGRRRPLIIGSFLFAVFNMAVARAEDLQTIFICRFFAGFGGAAPLTVVPATFSDIFGNRGRGTALVIFCAAVFAGPLIAPVVGGFISYSYLGWRWTEYLTSIMGFFGFALTVLFIEETYAPVLLIEKAEKLRIATGNWGIHARQEQISLDFKELIENNFSRPIKMLVTEPILLLITIYTAFVYGILYLLLEAYPIIFYEGYHMKVQVSMLPYIGMVVGQLIGCGIVLAFEPRTLRLIIANGGRPVPEARLVPTMVGGVLLPIGMFWLTWTGAYPHSVHWAAPAVSGIFIGSGIILIFLTSITYLVESYLIFAASAIAANTMLRSGFGAGFPLFATAMFHNLGVQWAGTLLGCIGILLAPVPMLFYIYGKRLRKVSKYAPNL